MNMKISRRQFEQNRAKANRFCPCGKSNLDGKFATEKGFEGQNVGHCHGCAKDFWPDSGTIEPIQRYTPIETVNYCSHSWDEIEQTFDTDLESGFAKFLIEVFGEKQAIKAVENYILGNYYGNTIFWQIDRYNNVRAGKVISYLPDGKRDKSLNPKAKRWMHKKGECDLNQCFYGDHLILDNNLPIAVAEGAKAAVIMSLIRPEYIWVSAESKGGLSKSKCESIVEYNVTLFPDAGCYELWKGKGDSYGFNTTKEVELLMQKGYIEDGDDITDYYLNWPEFRAALKPKKIKKIDPEWNAFVKQNPELGLKKN